MKALSHSIARLSIPVLAVVMASATAQAAAPSPYYGRWTVGGEHSAFTARGRQYKSIDITQCGKDFCGVSLDDKGRCGPVLFRFLSRHAHGQDTLYGHGRWGTMTKNIQIDTWGGESESPSADRGLTLFLGDGHSFGDRSENMPRFHAEYRRTGSAMCRAR
ncbi:hypothetical protein [Novosphingobium sp.]|uniref:hypothetical protein n=1 Tax=Novosphingobium sp. TaxID=1874826 RepID=UPI0025EAB24F|nr:hypothetical protein [Novosphingobium sp.]